MIEPVFYHVKLPRTNKSGRVRAVTDEERRRSIQNVHKLVEGSYLLIENEIFRTLLAVLKNDFFHIPREIKMIFLNIFPRVFSETHLKNDNYLFLRSSLFDLSELFESLVYLLNDQDRIYNILNPRIFVL